MEASEDKAIEVRFPDPAFGPDWPEAVRSVAEQFFSFDPQAVRNKDRMGSLSFDDAPTQMEGIERIVKDLGLEKWDDIPPSVTGALQGQMEELCNTLQQMIELSADSETPGDRRNELQNRLQELFNWFRENVAPHTTTAKIRRVGGDGSLDEDRLKELRGEIEELLGVQQQLRQELASQSEAVKTARKASGESAGDELSAVFNDRADDYDKTSKTWLIALCVSAPIAVVLAIVTFLLLRPDGESHDPSDFAGLGLGLFIFGILAFGIRVCVQNFRVNRHLATIARSKASAISTFQRLTASVEDDQIRSAVTLTLAQAVFTVEETGLVDGSGDHVTLVERAVLPNLPGTGS
jgi:hypothetical protein